MRTAWFTGQWVAGSGLGGILLLTDNSFTFAGEQLIETESIPEQQTASLIALNQFVELVTHHDLNKMLSQALSLLVHSFEARAGSLLYVGQTTARVCQGELAGPIAGQIRLWEESVTRQLGHSTGRISASRLIPFTLHPMSVPGGKVTLLNAPLMTKSRVAGCINLVCSPTCNELDQFQHQLLSRLLRGIGNLAELVENLSLTQQRLSQLGLFYQVGQALVSTFDLPQLLQDTMQLAASVINAAASSLMLVDEKRQELIFAAAYGAKGPLLRSQRIAIDEGIAGWVARRGEPIIANDVSQDPRFSRRVDVRTGFLTHSILAVPMQLRGKTIGVLEVLNKLDEESFDEEDMRLILTLAAQAAIAIENARLYQSLREERDRILSAQEDVRHELNRKLHDGTVQLLAAIAMGIDHVERLLQLRPDAVYAELEALRKLTRQAMRDARMILFELRPVILESQGLVPALQRYVEQLQQSEPFRVHFDAGGFEKQVGRQVAGAIFAIVQEAVNNVKKHAKSNNLWIQIAESGDHLVVNIEDDGLGFDLATVEREYEKQDSFGLLNMRERAALIEGELSIESSEVIPEQGTIVTLRVPLSRALVNDSSPNLGSFGQ
jgi:signal transduction histidine kinase